MNGPAASAGAAEGFDRSAMSVALGWFGSVRQLRMQKGT